jgi:hypothetical protein
VQLGHVVLKFTGDEFREFTMLMADACARYGDLGPESSPKPH